MKRRFLFLQGVNSPFFPRLSDRLRADGHRVYRINFCAGDVRVWGARPSWAYRGTPAELPQYLDGKFRDHGFTDLVLFGDQRPIHRSAIEMAQARGLRVLVFEEGYLRPNWLTLERGGANAHSSLPRDPAWYREVDHRLPRYRDARPPASGLGARAGHDLAYHLANALNPLVFPAYRTHRPHAAVREYAGWIKRYACFPVRRRRDARVIQNLLNSSRRYFVLPLQLNGDIQIRRHSSFAGMPAVIEAVLKSFAASAPRELHLLIKNHPLDTGLIDYERLIAKWEGELGLQKRVYFIETGHLPALLGHARGVVTVNSTTGVSALGYGCPTLALGRALYDLPGLTHQGGLDGFWSDPRPPERVLFGAFRNTVIHTTQVNGGLYDRGGIDLALQGCPRLMKIRSPLEELLW